MLVVGTRKSCRVGLAVVLIAAVCVLTLLDLPPPRLPDPPTVLPPTPGSEPPGTRSIVAYSWARRLALDYRPPKECKGNRTFEMTLDELKLPTTKWLETLTGRLFLYSAHLDTRVPGYPNVRVIGVKRGPLPTATLFCNIWYENSGKVKSLSVEALISPIWLDEWGNVDESYTGILTTCQIPWHVTSNPLRVQVGTFECQNNPSQSIAINKNVKKNVKRQFTVCIKGVDFDEDISEKLVAFIELHRILGASLFYFYLFNVHENVRRVLKIYERLNVVRWFELTLPGNLPNEINARRRLLHQDVWMKRRMELIPYNHCFYENIGQSEYVVPIDLDEVIIPRNKRTWRELLSSERRRLGNAFNDFASYAVRNVYFFPELQNKSTGKVDFLDTVRTDCVSPEGDSVKSFISTKRTLMVHNHYALTSLDPSMRRAHHFDPKDALKHHHRVCDYRRLDCDLLMENIRSDESVLRYAQELRDRIQISLNRIYTF